MNKILVIVGPTASGKSELAVTFAKKYNGEIISCDSRQVYRGLNIGTGKVEGKWIPVLDGRQKQEFFVYKNVIHHLIDFISPTRQFSVSQFQKQAQKVITDILKRRKLPILCGGTAQYINAVVYNQPVPEVKPNKKLRARLEKLSANDLYLQLKKLDPQRASTIDAKNPRRLIRALEVVITTGKPVPLLQPITYGLQAYHSLWLGINPLQNTLYKKIELRLKQRLKHGMVTEVKKLYDNGLSWKKLESFGLEYKHVSLYLQKKLAYNDMLTQLSFAIKHYSKRQMTWWKKNKKIKWIKNPKKAAQLVEKFLK